MLIQIVLTLALVAYGAYAQFQRRTSEIITVLSMMACVAGLILVWNPGLANNLAHIAGVGRGADLVFYIFIAVSGFIGLHLHLGADRNLRMITELARAIALQAPLRPGVAALFADLAPPRHAERSDDAKPGGGSSPP
jgi:small membrane protein